MFDRIYGRLHFPPVIRRLLDCPGLLRLRKVHMSSIPFMNYPSFSSVNRFEHALGVCHLAQLASTALSLSATEKTELMCAALYHDVATPPFAHVTEELMGEFFNFDHEVHLRNLLVGNTEDLGMERLQIYKGKGLKLQRMIHSKEARRLGLDIFRIADMATGKGKLGPLVKGQIDLDNIDNVIRAATAMGIKLSGYRDAEALALSFRMSKDGLSLYGSSIGRVRKWQQTRYTLYDMIYGDVEDFSLQTMLKIAVKLLIHAEDDIRILPLDWRLTDEALIRERILHDENAKKIWERITLYKPYPCVGIFYLRGLGAYPFVKNNLDTIEERASKHFKSKCFANLTLDKRHRALTYPLTAFWQKVEKRLDVRTEESIFLYIFSTRKPRQRQGHYLEFAQELRSMVPSNIDLKMIKRIIDEYPRLVEVRSV